MMMHGPTNVKNQQPHLSLCLLAIKEPKGSQNRIANRVGIGIFVRLILILSTDVRQRCPRQYIVHFSKLMLLNVIII